MGRLFWKFFLCILLAQLAATVGIGGAIWLKNRNPQQGAGADIDTSPPAEMAINAAASTLQFGGAKAMRALLEAMDHHRVFALDDTGHELLGRVVTPAMQGEARQLLKTEGAHRVVREVSGSDGHRYLLFLPSREHQRGLDGPERPLLAGLAHTELESAQAVLSPRKRPPAPPDRPRRNGEDGENGDTEPGQRSGMPQRTQHDPFNGGPSPTAGDRPAMRGGPMGGEDGANRGGPQGPGGRQGPPGPRFEPLKPWVPILTAVLASLLFAVLLAWYFSRPIRSLRQAFEAAAGGDLAPRFGAGKDKRGDELNDLGRDFDRMTARLRNLIDGQTRLLHDVSHELRSPLARLQAAIGLAHQQPEKMAASMERIERESVRMDKLVGELLTLARLEAGALSALPEEISMAELLDQIADDASFEAASARRKVVIEGDADVLVMGQTDLLGRAIENVVRNAIKHSPEGGTVQLQLDARPEKRQLHIRVLDRGPGVAPADLEAIFRPFFRSSDTLRSTEGHGLGLAIAQQVVQAHGGGISATNRPDGGGLCVEIVLPAAPLGGPRPPYLPGGDVLTAHKR
ncbi:HAMP domain-containing protein [Oxalobacteraceae bacterium]|nr:HAMP domain-containing protein [Oxalobacteraceae bacterium]